jgi:hypothetical protein
MIPSFVRPEVDQDACGDHAILLLHAKTVGRDANAALLSKSWKGVGPHVKCRCGRHFCYGDLSENKSTCTLCLPKKSQTQAAVAAPAAATAAPASNPRALVDDVQVRQHVTLIECNWACGICKRTRNWKKRPYTSEGVQHHVRRVHLSWCASEQSTFGAREMRLGLGPWSKS